MFFFHCRHINEIGAAVGNFESAPKSVHFHIFFQRVIRKLQS